MKTYILYQSMSDTELSLALLRATNPDLFDMDIDVTEGSAYGVGIWRKGVRGVDGFICSMNINNWNDIMPLAFQHGLDIRGCTLGDVKCTSYPQWGRFEIEDKSPNRAIAIAILGKIEAPSPTE